MCDLTNVDIVIDVESPSRYEVFAKMLFEEVMYSVAYFRDIFLGNRMKVNKR